MAAIDAIVNRRRGSPILKSIWQPYNRTSIVRDWPLDFQSQNLMCGREVEEPRDYVKITNTTRPRHATPFLSLPIRHYQLPTPTVGAFSHSFSFFPTTARNFFKIIFFSSVCFVSYVAHTD
jgi:hypothetical protein